MPWSTRMVEVEVSAVAFTADRHGPNLIEIAGRPMLLVSTGGGSATHLAPAVAEAATGRGAVADFCRLVGPSAGLHQPAAGCLTENVRLLPGRCARQESNLRPSA
jgi:hypothetical protein